MGYSRYTEARKKSGFSVPRPEGALRAGDGRFLKAKMAIAQKAADRTVQFAIGNNCPVACIPFRVVVIFYRKVSRND